MKSKIKNGALYPYDDLDKSEMKPVWDKLDEALNDERATNIAVSAPYDTGKSSFLLSYFTQKYKDNLNQKSYKFHWLPWRLHFHRFPYYYFYNKSALLDKARLDRKIGKTNFKFINLPNFFLEVKDKKESEIELEKDIIGQLLFSSKQQKYPDSRIKRLKQYPLRIILFFFIVSVLFVISTYLVEQNVTKIDSTASSFQLIIRTVSILTGIILLFSIFYIMFHGLPKIGWSISTKILDTKLDAKFDMNSEKEDKDLFLLYGDELKYYFSKSKVRYLIFEDLDRYDNPLIFQRLRQLNLNLNHGDKNKIVFIYTLKDSVFDSNESGRYDNQLDPIIKETKFFDYIIPMIPLHSTQNSISRFEKEINNKNNLQVNNVKEDSKYCYSVQEKYLWGLGSFILDIRTIIQICSELSYYAELFRVRLDNKEIDINKLLGMIVYKTVYPRDYEKLLSSDSFLNQLFLEINKQKERNLEERKSEIRKLENKIKDIDKKLQYIRNNKELYLNIFYDKFLNNIGKYRDIKYESNTFYKTKFWNEFFKDVSEEKKNIQDFFEWDDELTETFKEIREGTFDRTKSKLYSRLKEQISKYYEQKNILQSLIENETFLDILDEKYDGSGYKALSNIRKLPILNYLLTNELIDQNYYEYISPSLTNDLTPPDLDFVQNVLNGIYDEGQNLQNISRIVEILNNSGANYRYAQSVKILSYLLVQPITSNIMQYIKTIIYYCKDSNRLNFIERCIDNLKIYQSDSIQIEESKISGIKALISALFYEYPEYFISFDRGFNPKFVQKNSDIFETFFSTLSKKVTSKELISEKELFDIFIKYNVFKNIDFDKLIMNWKDDSWMNLFDEDRIYLFSNLSKIFSGNLTQSDRARISFLIRNGDYTANIDNFSLIVRAVGGLTNLIEKEKVFWEIDDNYIVTCLPSFLYDENLNYENLIVSVKFAKSLYNNQQKINLISTLINYTKQARKQNKISDDEYEKIIGILQVNN
ncbi:hypothetical protein [Lactobacillus intestinalis]|uniref:YobI family P-loop NTPase n=1 Tax=Lactobacillus intestinalis TaxID=151781 RepID=UPI001F591B2A|nr:hypothetical protein [Lactobacillus intestinalis]